MLAAKVEILAGPGLVVVTLGRSGGIVAVNLATAMAATGARVAVVDAEGADAAIAALRDPSRRPPRWAAPAPTGREAGASSGGPGLRQRRRRRPRPGGRAGRAARRRSRRPPATAPTAPAGCIAELLDEGDAVVVHAPPFQRSPNGLAWARVAEGTILVAERERTTQRELVSALESLRLVDARLVGTILTPPVPGLRG